MNAVWAVLIFGGLIVAVISFGVLMGGDRWRR